MQRLMVIGIVVMLAVVGCEPPNSQTVSQAKRNEQTANKEVGEVAIRNATEAKNVKEHILRKDDPATIQFIYVYLPGVGLVYNGPVLGGVTSSQKALKPPYKPDYVGNGGVKNIPLPHTSGTYGDEDSYVYWRDPAGNYYQTKLPYFMSDAPIDVPEPELSVGKIDMEMKRRAEQAEKAIRQGKDVTNDLKVKD